MATQDVTNGGAAKWSPPYTSFTTLMNTINRMSEEGGVPSRIDGSYLSNMPGGSRPTFMASLKAFGLTDNQNKPTTELTRLVAADEDERKEIVGDLVRAFYPDVLDLPNLATQAQLEDIFRGFGVSGSTLRKAVAFFLAAAKYADIKHSPHFRLPKPQAGEARPRRSTRRAAAPTAPAPETPRTPGPTAGLHPLIQGLIQELPPANAAFPKAKQEDWLELARVTFRLIYQPTGTEPEVSSPDEEDGEPD
jgi:hypothetical protein